MARRAGVNGIGVGKIAAEGAGAMPPLRGRISRLMVRPDACVSDPPTTREMIGLYHAHSGLRFLVLLAGLVALAYFAYGAATRRPADRLGNILGAMFNGLLDLQIVLGFVLILLGLYYPMVIGHLVLMLAAAAVAHVLSVVARRAAEPRRHHVLRLAGVAGALLLVAAGIGAIGRGLFEMRLPTI